MRRKQRNLVQRRVPPLMLDTEQRRRKLTSMTWDVDVRRGVEVMWRAGVVLSLIHI